MTETSARVVVRTWRLKIQDVLHFSCISNCSREKRRAIKKRY